MKAALTPVELLQLRRLFEREQALLTHASLLEMQQKALSTERVDFDRALVTAYGIDELVDKVDLATGEIVKAEPVIPPR